MDAHHGSVEEGVDVEHGFQLQSVVQTGVLVTVPGTKTPAWVRLHGFRRFPSREPLRVSPVHASQRQFDVWILEQHSGEEVLLGGMDQERCVYDLQTHMCIRQHRAAALVLWRVQRRIKARFHI